MANAVYNAYAMRFFSELILVIMASKLNGQRSSLTPETFGCFPPLACGHCLCATHAMTSTLARSPPAPSASWQKGPVLMHSPCVRTQSKLSCENAA